MAIAIITSFGQIGDANGVPLSGGSVTVYAAGTTTPLSLYSNSGLSVSAANPVTLDASGRHDMRYIATAAYKIVVKNSAGSTVYTRDNIDPGVSVGSGALPVANGGTGSTTAAGARTNLAAAAASDVATLQSDMSNIQTWAGYNLTTRTRIASGTTAQRPSAGAVGWRYNSTTGRFEADNGSAWKNVVASDLNLATDLVTGGGVVCLKRSRALISSSQTISSTTIGLDTSIPQITEGTEITGSPWAFTPVSASSVIRVHIDVFGSMGTATAIAALFKDSAANAVAANAISTSASGIETYLPIDYEFAPGSTSAISFALRMGVNTSSFVFHGSNTLGGVKTSQIIIEEWLTP